MPNHCHNRLSVFGAADAVAEFVRRANGALPVYDQSFAAAEAKAKREGVTFDPASVDEGSSVLSFNAVVPLPGYVRGMKYSGDGYELESKTWGVKWGAYNEVRVYDGGDLARYEFTTAWSVAEEFFTAASRLFPTLTFALSFYEEYPTLGRFEWRKGIEMSKVFLSSGAPCAKDDDEADSDEWRERVYLPWHRQYYDKHDEWVAELRGNAPMHAAALT